MVTFPTYYKFFSVFVERKAFTIKSIFLCADPNPTYKKKELFFKPLYSLLISLFLILLTPSGKMIESMLYMRFKSSCVVFETDIIVSASFATYLKKYFMRNLRSAAFIGVTRKNLVQQDALNHDM